MEFRILVQRGFRIGRLGVYVFPGPVTGPGFRVHRAYDFELDKPLAPGVCLFGVYFFWYSK